jgi:hypothetical protein
MFLENLPKDEASMRMAHPFRTTAFGGNAPEMLRGLVGESEWSRFIKILRDESLLAGSMVVAIQDQGLRRLTELVRAAAGASGSTEMGGAMPFLVMLRHAEMPYPIFRIEDALVDILTKTDISDDIPMAMLPLPYPRLYVELGQSRTIKETLSNVESGLHILEGAYIERGMHEHLGEGYYIMLTGSPLGKSDAMDDATLALFLPINSGEARLQDVLNEAVRSANLEARAKGLRETPLEWTEQCHRCLLLLIKALLYISLPDARRQLHPERTEALKDLQRLKSPGKRAKAERRLKKLSDFVVIKAAAAHEKAFSEGATREGGVKPHWRRAHYRMQAHGPQMSLRKLIFITEVLVGMGEHDEGKTPVQDYVVR